MYSLVAMMGAMKVTMMVAQKGSVLVMWMVGSMVV